MENLWERSFFYLVFSLEEEENECVKGKLRRNVVHGTNVCKQKNMEKSFV
jgi:hypothetical protein